MRECHQGQIARWAEFVRDNPTKWKKIHTQFIDAIFDKHTQFVGRLKKTPDGEKKLQELYGKK